MNLKQAKQYLPVLFDARVSVELRSSPGIGSTNTELSLGLAKGLTLHQ